MKPGDRSRVELRGALDGVLERLQLGLSGDPLRGLGGRFCLNYLAPVGTEVPRTSRILHVSAGFGVREREW